MADIFLTPEDRHKLQGLYEIWNLTASPKHLIPLLYKYNVISIRDKQEIDACKTEYEKNDYIFDNVLIKSPYDQLEIIYDILLEVGDTKHKHIANLLPRCTQSLQHRQPFQQHGHGAILSDPIQDTASHTSHYMLGHTSHMAPVIPPPVPSVRQPYITSVGNNQPSPQANIQRMNNPATYNNDETLLKTTQGCQQSLPSVAVHQSTSRLGFYGTKPRNDKRTGKGVCAIIANFTGDLIGYERDVQAVAEFFEGSLNYDVFGADNSDGDYRNLTKERLKSTLVKIQQYLNDSLAASRIDRFFLFILTHGDKYGINTCAEGSDIQTETNETGQTVHVTPEEIINMFTHESLPKLKDYPKCIFMQNCRGTENVQAAAYAESPNTDLQPYTPLTDIAIGADILVCHATKLGMLSWVSDQGSWFVKEIIDTFKQHYTDEHIIDLIGEVNNRISQKTGQGAVGGQSMQVRQLPDICYSLRKKFYLSIPVHLLDQ